MSCKLCDAVQDLAFDKNIPESTGIAYIRIENANVAIVACPVHAKMACDMINAYRKAKA